MCVWIWVGTVGVVVVVFCDGFKEILIGLVLIDLIWVCCGCTLGVVLVIVGNGGTDVGIVKVCIFGIGLIIVVCCIVQVIVWVGFGWTFFGSWVIGIGGVHDVIVIVCIVVVIVDDGFVYIWVVVVIVFGIKHIVVVLSVGGIVICFGCVFVRGRAVCFDGVWVVVVVIFGVGIIVW